MSRKKDVFLYPMKQSLLVITLLFICSFGVAQRALPMPEPTPVSKETEKKRHILAWHIDERYGIADTIVLKDTAITSYQDRNPINDYSIVNSWNGNLGSPAQSKLFFDRTHKSGILFGEGYDPYTITPADIVFFNTTTPYSNLTYHSSLPRYREQDYFKALLSLNLNKNVNIGGLTNLIYGRGQYANQASRMLNAALFGSYSGKRYALNAVIIFNNFRNQENGGIQDPSYLMGDYWTTTSIPTKLASANNSPIAQTNYRNNIYYLNHKYSLGFDKERRLSNDSLVSEFIPVTSFIHTIKFEDVVRRYVETSVPDSFYRETYYNHQSTYDSIRFFSLKNTLAITLEEKFNTLLNFGLAAFIEYDLQRYLVTTDTISYANNYENYLRVGATLAKNEGKNIKYSLTGQIYVAGSQTGQFDLEGDLKKDFRLWRDTMSVDVAASFSNAGTDLFYDYFRSNHFRWETNFKTYQQLMLSGRLTLPKRNFSLGVKVANITNYLYIDHRAMPAQYDGNVQVITADAKVNLKAWKLHLDNQFVYQFTSVPEVLPLPTLSLYSNFYFKDVFFNVLTTQLGISCRYHTAYYANSYMPATGLFYLQNQTLIGNYPELNVYVNFHLKRMRFFAQYANLNFNRFGGTNYYLMPDYPMNPATFQFGLSWNFYD